MLNTWRERLQSRKGGVMLACGAVTCIVAGTLVYRETRQITTQAFINAPVITLRAPIPGRTQLEDGLRVGRRIAKGEQLGAVVGDTENPRISELTGNIAELVSQRAARQAEIEAIDVQLAHRRKEMAEQQQRASVQQTVDVQGARASLALAVAEFERANTALGESRSKVERYDSLRTSGFISVAAYDTAKAEEDMARAAQRASKEAVQRAETVLTGARQGVQLDGSRGLPYAVTRSQEIAQSIADLTARKGQLDMQIQAIVAEAAVLQRELDKQTSARLTSPVQGAIWSIDANSGNAVTRQGAVLQLVNCEDRWVEAFFSEKDAARMAAGTRVKVRSYYDAGHEWDGEVISVRYGTGRVTVGQYVVDPPPEVMRRQLPVRVATARIQVEWGPEERSAPLCNVGRSVEVLPSDGTRTSASLDPRPTTP
ncbi:HlyD family secretion protein [Ideonella livida]|uniref:HlyD family efflux transporter periplasmic adaptor subunit n=1 Tax=Ideonella livida TaxID=2707176 RepID=A0A7C9PI50_9BURK|nr:HlyD family efflux transporter periplasmic adaptor subunit [Ideonella livida]NDY92388.1 HlyD family efflux transporter periplasmic adaptor subunit [Ideonella livida]